MSVRTCRLCAAVVDTIQGGMRMSNTERQTIRFSDTGIGAPTDDVERVPLTDGVKFIVNKIEVRTSNRYGEYVVFDGENLDGEEFHGYSMSGVILEQAKALLEQFGGKDGTLTNNVICEVRALISESTGRKFYTLM